MKTILVSIDSKYIHTNLAVRYLKANCDFPTEILEFTIKDPQEKIFRTIENLKPDIIGFSVYIWNVEIIKKLTSSLKKVLDCIIIWGGPEISHDSETYFDDYPIDYIIRGEGELSFNRLIEAIINKKLINTIPNLTYRQAETLQSTPSQVIERLENIKNPYHFPEFISSFPSKVQYVESSRGCPFHCTYCLASLDNQVRYFSLERVKEDLSFLMTNGAKTFKFLDRTFNLKSSRVCEVVEFIVANHVAGSSFQFEISGDILTDELIDKIHAISPKDLIRFEIGIQSTNSVSNKAVSRVHNLDKLFSNIQKIQQADIIDLHLDLIAGLPKEDIHSFEDTFNRSFACYAKELQLGFLKMLKGTPIRRDADKYGYVYNPLPPYEIIRNKVLTENDVEELRLVEKMLNMYWNKGFMDKSMRFITERVASAFNFFRELAHFYIDNNFDFSRYQLIDVFLRLNQFLVTRYPEIQVLCFSELKRDYLEYNTFRPKIWWNHKNIHKNDLLRTYFKTDQTFPLDTLYKYSVVSTYLDKYMIVLYLPDKKVIRYMSLS